MTCRFVCWPLAAESMDGDDQHEKDRWVIENSMFQVIPITPYGMLTLWGVCVSGLVNHRLNLDFYRLHARNYVFMEWTFIRLPSFGRTQLALQPDLWMILLQKLPLGPSSA